MTLDTDRVRLFLKKQKKTGEWLAVQLNCSINTVRNILAGKPPRVETLIALARLLGCQVEDLITPGAKRAS